LIQTGVSMYDGVSLYSKQDLVTWLSNRNVKEQVHCQAT
jgi:hypothetical protein